MGRLRGRVSILLALALVTAVVAPALAFGALKPATVVPDAFESDDTTTTAKANGTLTEHTVTSLTDTDFSYIDVTATDTPIVVENTWEGGWGGTIPMVYSYDASSGAITSIASMAPPFGNPLAPGPSMVRAPRPGRYFIASLPMPLVGAAGGRYLHLQALSQVIRVAGANRYSTAAAVSRKIWPMTDSTFAEFIAASGGADAFTPRGCIVATGRGFADALAAGAWAAKNGPMFETFPILLTEPDSLSPETAEEILRLSEARRSTTATFTVYVVGGTPAVSDAVKGAIADLNVDGWTQSVTSVERIGGIDRFETAAMIASKAASSTSGISDTVFIANGFSYADALAAAPVAARGMAPILLVNKDAVPTATSAFLTAHPGITKAVVVGGPSVVATSVLDTLTARPLTVTRVSGPDRYATSEEIAKYGVDNYGMMPISCVLVTGENYPDGLAAVGISAFQHTPILLTPRASLSSAITDFYSTYPVILPSYIVGGEPAVSAVTESQFNAIRLPAGP